MAYFASLSGNRVTAALVTVPYYGLWSADVTLALSDEVSDAPFAAVLTIGNLTLTGSVFRSAAFAGNRTLRLVGGGGGWRRPVASRYYLNSGGVPVAAVLGDLAVDAGERVSIGLVGNVGTAFTREGGAPASRTLKQVAGRSWYVDLAGTTQVRPRPTTAIGSAYQVESFMGAMGRFIVSTEDLAAWMPGAVFANPLVTTPRVVSSVSIGSRDDGKLRLEVLTQ